MLVLEELDDVLAGLHRRVGHDGYLRKCDLTVGRHGLCATRPIPAVGPATPLTAQSWRPLSLAHSRTLTGSGSSCETSPPSIATSLASDDDTNEYCGVVATKKGSPPRLCLFLWARRSCYSQSVQVR